jgi:hypothetical protein
MNSLGAFVAFFIVASGITAAVNSIAYGGSSGKIVHETIRFFFMIILGILFFSVLVYGLELLFLPK